MCSTICFNMYILVLLSTINIKHIFEGRNGHCVKSCQQQQHGKSLHTFFLMEKTIAEIYEKFYIPDKQKIAFHFPHGCILDNYQCGR